MPSIKELSYSIYLSFKKREQKRLRKLSDEIVKQNVISFTKQLFNLAVFSYILSKILSKPRYTDRAYAGKMADIEHALSEVAEKIEGASDAEVEKLFATLELSIHNLESTDRRFLIDLISKGRLKVAAIMYAQGISLGLASQLTGIGKQDIMDYAGKTMMFDRVKEEKDVKERLKAVRRIIEE